MPSNKAPSKEPSFRDQSAGFLANHMARLFAKALADAIRPLDLAPAQFMTLLALWRGDGLTQRELVARLDVEQATMASTLNRMERDGLIARRPHPEDGRAQSIHLTARARRLERAAISAAAAINERALTGFNRQERERLIAAMRQIIDNLGDAIDGAPHSGHPPKP